VHFFRIIFNSAKKVLNNKINNKSKLTHTEQPLIKHPQSPNIKNKNF